MVGGCREFILDLLPIFRCHGIAVGRPLDKDIKKEVIKKLEESYKICVSGTQQRKFWKAVSESEKLYKELSDFIRISRILEARKVVKKILECDKESDGYKGHECEYKELRICIKRSNVPLAVLVCVDKVFNISDMCKSLREAALENRYPGDKFKCKTLRNFEGVGEVILVCLDCYEWCKGDNGEYCC